MEKKNDGCCSCEADMKKEVKAMVNEVEGYTAADHTRKEAEVKAAFGHEAHHGAGPADCTKVGHKPEHHAAPHHTEHHHDTHHDAHHAAPHHAVHHEEHHTTPHPHHKKNNEC